MISAVVHTFNEEKNIDRSLSSLTSWVDEIILVDMHSTDRTVTKAKEYKARIFDHPYTGFVEPARNFAISKSRGDWVFILDADEEVPRTLADELKKIAKEKVAEYCRIPRKNIIWGKWIRYSGWWPDYKIRFFKKGTVRWEDKIHGIPLTSGQCMELSPKEELSIVHHNYQSLEQFINRMNRYTTISAKELFIENRIFHPGAVFSLSTGEFVNRFFLREGYKDGLHGLALSLLQAFSEAVVQLKLWELYNFKEEKITLKEVESYFNLGNKQKSYWLNSERLKQNHNIVNDIIWRMRRKLASL